MPDTKRPGTGSSRETSSTVESQEVADFHIVLDEEIEAINTRRAALSPQRASLENTGDDNVLQVNGLALSGGGIRSAAFGLGALQALDRAGLINRIDYISSVSGGGYIASSLVAAMARTKGQFPFESKADAAETRAVGHIRDFSNYLLPNLLPDLLKGLVIYLRGIAANVVLILPWLLFAAALSGCFNLRLDRLDRNMAEGFWYNLFNVDHFVLSSIGAALFFIALIGWSIVRSRPFYRGSSDVKWFAGSFAIFLVMLGIVVMLELQPIILKAMINHGREPIPGQSAESGFGPFVSAVPSVLAGFSTLVGFFSRFLAQVMGGATEKSSIGRKLASALSAVAIWIAAAAVPFLLWVAFLILSYWALPDTIDGEHKHFFAPQWLENYAVQIFGDTRFAVGLLYGVMGAALLFLSALLDPNANSLHRLYRDRLSKAFLFDPTPQGRGDLPEQDTLQLKDIDTTHTPYPLINSAINLQSSKIAKRRGRRADFFLMSPLYVGSDATRYAKTADMGELDLGTALAISGAAASSNMGSRTIKILAPTLALLNIRLGYWMRNPQYTKQGSVTRLLDRTDLYFLHEMLGLLTETSWLVYLTDGGHIENLGIYALLKRRCRIIIAIDSEADQAMTFHSLAVLQRHARIDLGVRIELDWKAIRARTKAVSTAIESEVPLEQHAGPHIAVGKIRYPAGDEGYLIYIKSSLTGDENDYVLDYKRRYPSFPHETTLDQLFTEEQFECYRALGFHATLSAFVDANSAPTEAANLVLK